MIEPVADRLLIPYHRIYANTLLFDEVTGDFAGFDASEPTSRDGGKPAVVQSLIDANGYSPMVMIGDGATDMQAKPPADVFIGFGGIVEREKVRDGADWFIRDFEVYSCGFCSFIIFCSLFFVARTETDPATESSGVLNFPHKLNHRKRSRIRHIGENNTLIYNTHYQVPNFICDPLFQEFSSPSSIP